MRMKMVNSNHVDLTRAPSMHGASTGSNTSGADSKKSHDYRGVLAALDFMSNDPPEPFSIFLTSRGAHPPYGAPLEARGEG